MQSLKNIGWYASSKSKLYRMDRVQIEMQVVLRPFYIVLEMHEQGHLKMFTTDAQLLSVQILL